MASLTQWAWVWVNSGSWWWTGRPGVLRSRGLQRVGHNWATGLNRRIHSYTWRLHTALTLITRKDGQLVCKDIIWPPDEKNWLTGKDPDAGKNWRQEEKGITEDEMVGWHYWLHEHEFVWALRVGDGQGSLVCCSPRGLKELDTTEQWTELKRD